MSRRIKIRRGTPVPPQEPAAAPEAEAGWDRFSIGGGKVTFTVDTEMTQADLRRVEERLLSLEITPQQAAERFYQIYGGGGGGGRHRIEYVHTPIVRQDGSPAILRLPRRLYKKMTQAIKDALGAVKEG